MLEFLYIKLKHGLLRTHFRPFCSKFNTVWGERGEAIRFTIITRKLPTLAGLTCISSNGEYFERTTEHLFSFSSAIS